MKQAKLKMIQLFFLMIFFMVCFSSLASSAQLQLIYVVQRGETLSEIATTYDVSRDKLMQWNDISNANNIRAGDELTIPTTELEEQERDFNKRLFSGDNDYSLNSQHSYAVRINPDQETPEIDDISEDELITYHVSPGDTIFEIAREFNTSIGVIEALNDMDNSDLRAGDTITVPARELSQRQALSRSISEEEKDLLARAIYGEARGEPYIGQVAVGAVIINRILSPDFPDDIESVIYQSGQFSPVEDGSIYLEPDYEAISAANEALSGEDPSGGALFFYNPDKATDREWTTRREVVVTIGNHVFMK